MPIDPNQLGPLIDAAQQAVGNQGLADVLSGVSGLANVQSTAEIPASVAKLVSSAVAGDARLRQMVLKQILETQAMEEKGTAGESMSRLRNRLAIREANASARRKIWEKQQEATFTATTEAARIAALTQQATRIQQRVLAAIGPDSPIAKEGLAALRGPQFKEIAGEAALLAGAAETSLNEQLETAVSNVLGKEEARYRKMGITPPGNLTADIRQRIQVAPATLQSHLDSEFDRQFREQRLTRKIESGEAKLKRAKTPEPYIAEFRAAAEAAKTTKAPKAVAAFEAGLEGAKVAAKKSMRRKMLGGAGVLAAAAYLLPKMFGEEKSDAVPPEIQMMMLQRMGGGGGQPVDEQVATGRELLNMTRAMSLIKMLHQMGQMQTGAPGPTMGVI